MFSNRCSKNSFQIKAIAIAKILHFPLLTGGWGGVGWGEGAPLKILDVTPAPSTHETLTRKSFYFLVQLFFFFFFLEYRPKNGNKRE